MHPRRCLRPIRGLLYTGVRRLYCLKTSNMYQCYKMLQMFKCSYKLSDICKGSHYICMKGLKSSNHSGFRPQSMQAAFLPERKAAPESQLIQNHDLPNPRLVCLKSSESIKKAMILLLISVFLWHGKVWPTGPQCINVYHVIDAVTLFLGTLLGPTRGDQGYLPSHKFLEHICKGTRICTNTDIWFDHQQLQRIA